ncbi:MAG: hypothetical protein IPL28_05220 [Chloroflexi bacterium]|nr:hypothetical protein [Chloroflexota bacterium]
MPEYAPPAAELLTVAHPPPEPSFRPAATPSFATYLAWGAHIAPDSTPKPPPLGRTHPCGV